VTGDVRPDDYVALLEAVKDEIAVSRVRAARAVNAELISLYWRIGALILERQAVQGWGARVIERLAADLRASFPGARGLSRRNLHYMRAFAEAWPEEVPQPVAQLPWGHVRVLLGPPRGPRGSTVVRRPGRRGVVVAGGVGDHGGQPTAPASGCGAVELSGDLARRRLRSGAGDHPRPRVPAPLSPCWTPGLPPTTSTLRPSRVEVYLTVAGLDGAAGWLRAGGWSMSVPSGDGAEPCVQCLNAVGGEVAAAVDDADVDGGRGLIEAQ